MIPAASDISVLLLDSDGNHSQNVALALGGIPGLRLHVVSNLRWPAVRWSRHVKSFRQWSGNGQSAGLLQICRTVRADVLLPVTEAGMCLVSENRKAFSGIVKIPPTPTPEAIGLVANKHLLARWLAGNRLPTPATLWFSSLADTRKQLSQLPFPVLLKPIVGGDGLGIRRFEAPAELLADLESRPPLPGSCILQTFISGRDVNCSVLCRDGKILACTTQAPLRPPRRTFGVANILQLAPHVSALATAEKILSALRWNGVANLDLREDEQGICHLVDFNPRYWQTLTASLAAGVNFPHLACLAACDIDFSRPQMRTVKFMTAQTSLKQLFTDWSSSSRCGLAYSLADPAPRLINLARKYRRLLQSARLPSQA